MRLATTAALVAVVTALVLTNALAGPPAPRPLIGATHAQPVAGQSFTGLTVARTDRWRIHSVTCHASLHGKHLVGRAQKFYGAKGIATISCTWAIPTGTTGELLTAWMRVYDTSGGYAGSGRLFKWRVK